MKNNRPRLAVRRDNGGGVILQFREIFERLALIANALTDTDYYPKIGLCLLSRFLS
jgi:hypothetical protein